MINLELTKGMPSRITSEILSVSGNNSVSFEVSDMRNSALKLRNYGGRVILETHFGMRLEYVAFNWALDIFIPDCYKNLMQDRLQNLKIAIFLKTLLICASEVKNIINIKCSTYHDLIETLIRGPLWKL